MTEFAKIFAVGDKQVLFFLEPDGEDFAFLHQIAECAIGQADVKMGGPTHAMEAAFNALDQASAEGFLSKTIAKLDGWMSDDDQDARQAVEGGVDAAPEFDFAAQSAATDGGLSAEVVQTLRTPSPATGFAEKANDNG